MNCSVTQTTASEKMKNLKRTELLRDNSLPKKNLFHSKCLQKIQAKLKMTL